MMASREVQDIIDFEEDLLWHSKAECAHAWPDDTGPDDGAAEDDGLAIADVQAEYRRRKMLAVGLFV